MKTISLITSAFLLITSQACESSTSPELSGEPSLNLTSLPAIGELVVSDSSSLIFMREEEKLARDVYQFFFEKYGLSVFDNISNSEQRHMDAIKVLLDRYQLTDPVTDNSPGVFKDTLLASLYNSLTQKGSESAVEAAKVGMLIEEIDIRDLEERFSATVSEDVLWVVGNLTRGSRNHLRGFNGYLVSQSVVYTPAILAQEVYNAIVSSPVERGGRNR
ncbi:MAG: DUF2202 domain-containing protein [Bacteroidetes bacterium]|nr:DUF2202 domain-containing protein [Bacteroidota bacterium]